MKLLITGVCGFVGKSLAIELPKRFPGLEIFGLDNLSRPGSESNRQALQHLGTRFFHGDIRNPADLESLPRVDWVIDASANPSVLAGISGQTSSRQLIEHNLTGTTHLLEFCKRHSAGFLLLSTSRVYSAARLSALRVFERDLAYAPDLERCGQSGLSAAGVAEEFSTAPPLSLYGAAKLASEILALEYGCAFGFPVVINRCGLLAGAGQFGKSDQGILSFWIHSYKWRRPLKYIGFKGTGYQVRDCLHPRDLADLVARQLRACVTAGPLNVSGGASHSISLAQLSHWCASRFGSHTVGAEPIERPFDVPWLVLDSTMAREKWAWHPQTSRDQVFEEIAAQAEQNAGWLDLSSGA